MSGRQGSVRSHRIARWFAVMGLGLCTVGSFSVGRTGAAESSSIPLAMSQGDRENRTWMWFCPDLGRAGKHCTYPDS